MAPAARKKTIRIALVLALILAASVVALVNASPTEPVSGGKTLREWVVYGMHSESNEFAACQAIQRMGDAAIPCLLHWLQARPSKFQGWIDRMLYEQSVITYRFGDDSYYLQELAKAGFAYLGETGRPAIPKLQKLIGDQDRGPESCQALIYIGEPAVPPVLALLNHPTKRVRVMMTSALIDQPLRQHPLLRAKLLQLIYDPEPEVKAHAVICLRDARGHPNEVAEALAKVARDRAHPGRLNAQHYLHPWSTNAALTLPIFQAGAHDPDAAIRRCAVDGLGKMRSGSLLDLVEEWLEDRDGTVRAIAVASLGRATNQIPDVTARLDRALVDTNSLVRIAAAGALAMLGPNNETDLANASALDEIRFNLRDADSETLWRINREAARALGFNWNENSGLPIPETLIPELVLKKRYSGFSEAKSLEFLPSHH